MTSDRLPSRTDARSRAARISPARTSTRVASAPTARVPNATVAAPITPITMPVAAAAANVLAHEGVPRFELAPHNCFACGTLNAHGLGLVLHVEHGRSWTELTLDRAFEGWEGIAHGGIICTILDEVMAWALVGADNWGVTARMNVSFRRPVPVGVPIRAEGSVATLRRRIVETTGRLVDGSSGEVLATATGTYVAAGADRKRDLRERYGFRLVPEETPDSVAPMSTASRNATAPDVSGGGAEALGSPAGPKAPDRSRRKALGSPAGTKALDTSGRTRALGSPAGTRAHETLGRSKAPHAAGETGSRARGRSR